MGRPPSNGGPAFRFSAKEAAEMESILQEHKIKMPSNDVIEALAEKFSQSAERAGKMSVQVKQVWNWFQNKRFALRSKLPRPLKATPVSAVPQDMAPVRNAPLVSQPQPVQIDHEGLNTKSNPSSEKQDHASSELEEGDCCEASHQSGSFHIQNKKMVENIGNSMAMGKEKSFVWTDALTRILIEMLTEYQRQNGKNGFSWIYLTESFEQKTNLKCKKETLKNKYNNMRGVWKLWTTLKHGETELGWDSEKQCIAASAEWWARKLQENKEYRIFKRNGFSPEIESMLKFLFQGTIGMESHCVAPSTVQKAPVPNSVLYQENVAASSKANHAMVPILEADANSAAQVASNQPKNTCAEALKIIEVMVEEGFLVQGSSLWCFAISMLCSGANRKIFTLLRSNKARLPWLEWEFKIEGKKGLLPDD